jgi:DNA-binding NtrC family response regulator
MSTQLVSEQLASLRRDERRLAQQPMDQESRALVGLSAEDIDVASASSARLLITASTQEAVETLARRIHASGRRAHYPFIIVSAGELSVGAEALSADCVRLLDAAAGGSLLIKAVEEMPTAVQESLIERLTALESARSPSVAVRLIAGTTVSLLGRIAAGTFSERLFYRLNIIHVTSGAGPPAVTRP